MSMSMSFLYGKEKFRLNNNNNNSNEETLENYKEQKAHERHWSQHDTVTVAEQNMIYDLLA
jgi:hypothetical protein